jgi:hypothetical protein
MVCRGAHKSLTFPICNTTKRMFLGWVKEVRTMRSWVCAAQGEMCKDFFFNPVARFLYKAKDLSAPSPPREHVLCLQFLKAPRLWLVLHSKQDILNYVINCDLKFKLCLPECWVLPQWALLKTRGTLLPEWAICDIGCMYCTLPICHCLLRFAIAVTRQYIITSSVFKLRVSSLAQRLAGYGAKGLFETIYLDGSNSSFNKCGSYSRCLSLTSRQ